MVASALDFVRQTLARYAPAIQQERAAQDGPWLALAAPVAVLALQGKLALEMTHEFGLSAGEVDQVFRQIREQNPEAERQREVLLQISALYRVLRQEQAQTGA